MKNNVLIIAFLLLAANLFAQPRVEWDRTLQTPRQEWASSGMVPTSDGGYLIGGDTYEYVENVMRPVRFYYVAKVDSNGNRQWEKMIGAGMISISHQLEQLPMGGIFWEGSPILRYRATKLKTHEVAPMIMITGS